jgi:hypothetical protein
MLDWTLKRNEATHTNTTISVIINRYNTYSLHTLLYSITINTIIKHLYFTHTLNHNPHSWNKKQRTCLCKTHSAIFSYSCHRRFLWVIDENAERSSLYALFIIVLQSQSNLICLLPTASIKDTCQERLC